MKYLSLSSGHFQCHVIDAELWFCAGWLLIMDSFLNVWVFSRISQLQTFSLEFPDALECLIKWRINFNKELMRQGGSSVCLGWRFSGSLLNLQVKFGAYLNLQEFYHWPCQNQHQIILDIYLAFTFITASHCLQLSLIILQSSFCSVFLFPFYLFFTFYPSSFVRPVYLTTKNFSEAGRRPL